MIQFREQADCHIFIVDGQETRKLRVGLIQTKVGPAVERLLNDPIVLSFDLCILDGVRQSLEERSLLMQLLHASDYLNLCFIVEVRQ